MKKKTMLYLLLIFSPIILFGLYVVLVILYGTFTDFKPKEKIVLELENQKLNNLNDSIIDIISWNIGYGSLGKNADFFLDGGKMIRSPKNDFKEYFEGISTFIEENKDKDFILLQEVDENSKRSYFTNEYEKIASILDKHSSVFAPNYEVNFVPVPLSSTSPLGKVKSGLATYSKYKSIEDIRYQYPGEYPWPKRIFHLDRCLLLKRIKYKEKELVLINSHNSAYDGGKLKPQEMDFLKKILIEEYEKGNYVVVGADWNQCPPNFEYNYFSKENSEDYFQSNIEKDYLPSNWQWVYDTKTPTNRKLSAPYKKGETFTTLLDFYLVSPNIEVLEVKTIDLDFAFSDHQAVSLKMKLK